MSSATYREAGVDIDAGEDLVRRIKPLAARTRLPEVLDGVGGFASLVSLPGGMRDPVLVSGTDGVGTKLRIAFELGVHDTVGIDLVAMCVNDVITRGARPLFFLDYFATAKLDVNQAEQVVAGIAEGCVRAGCALVGGETAELPGFYTGGEYDLAGFAVGVVERDELLDGRSAEAGDVLVGLPSTGLHSNGFSLARQVLLTRASLRLDGHPPGWDRPLGHVLLEPTRIYVKAALEAVAAGGVRAMCHVTGGGVPGNLPRVLPNHLKALVDESAIMVPEIFGLIARLGEVEREEMRRTFNMGVGYVLVVARDRSLAVTRALRDAGESPFVMGELASASGPEEPRVSYR